MKRAMMNISLPADLKKQIDASVKRGSYTSRSEYIRALMRASEDAWETYEAKLQKGARAISLQAIQEAVAWAKIQ